MFDLDRIAALAADASPEAPSTAAFWTDPYISARLLEAHLDPATDAASRRPAAQDATLAWLEREVLPRSGRVLDLGCGPGLYALELARRGYAVTGLDWSERSLAYARERAAEAGLAVDYRQGNYLDCGFGAGYEAALMIYCDLGALDPAARLALLKKVRAALAPGGAFAFDLWGEGLPASVAFGKDWTIGEGGFWSAGPHLALTETSHFPERKLVQRRVLLAEAAAGRTERFMIRDYYFSDAEIAALVREAGFADCSFRRGFLPPVNWGGADPVFVVARA
jgi:SAM-dependent methyltransferase